MEERRRENIVIFPFMAQGHIIPFLALALQIEQKGYQITFINTPLNIKNLRRTLPPATTIRLLEIPFNPADHGLPPDGENTDDLPYDLIFRLLQASASLEPAFRTLLSDLVQGGDPPLAIIADIFLGWTAAVAHEIRSEDDNVPKPEVGQDEEIQGLSTEVICSLRYRNVMEVEHLLNYPSKNDAVMESPTDEEIIQSVINTSNDVENDPDPDDSSVLPNVSSKEAF